MYKKSTENLFKTLEDKQRKGELVGINNIYILNQYSLAILPEWIVYECDYSAKNIADALFNDGTVIVDYGTGYGRVERFDKYYRFGNQYFDKEAFEGRTVYRWKLALAPFGKDAYYLIFESDDGVQYVVLSCHLNPDKVVRVISNEENGMTIVFTADGKKTMVTCQKGDKYDKEKGIAFAMCKYYMNSKEFYNLFG